ncbi:MAG TPA: phage terminase large subunit [Chloroflexota bacterium]
MPTLTKLRNVTFVRPRLYDKQLEAIYATERYSIIEASTKSGKTVGCMVWLTEQAWLGKRGFEYWWVAPIYEQAKIVFRRLKRGLTPNTFTTNESDLSITLANGAVLRFKGADNPDSLYGEDVHAAVIDEATRVKEEAWHAVRSTLTATRGPVRIIGNVKGRRNWAYKLARRAEAGEPGMHYARITASDAVSAGVLDQDEIDDARRQLPAQVYRELFEAEPSDDEGNPFGYEAIRACIGPLSDKPPVAWGWDLARANDWTVGVGLDAQGKVCQLHRWNQTTMPRKALSSDAGIASSHPEYWQVTLNRVRSLVAKTAAYVDSTGPGGPIDQALSEGGQGNIEGYVFTSRSKQLLMEGLAVAIQQHVVQYPEGLIPNELEAFEYEYTRTGVRYSAPEGLHDDAVCALALAVAKFNERRVGKFEAAGLAAMIRSGQVVTMQPGGIPEQPKNELAEWMRGLR